MKRKLLLIITAFLWLELAYSQSSQRPDFLKKDSIQSSLDGNVQVFYYGKSTASELQPLIVALHSWSGTADSQKETLVEQTQAKDWNYIFPDFRGVNNHPKACCSEFVIADIDEAIDWALKNMNVDKKKIYVVGNSGGGYATMAMYMKSRHTIASFSAWSSISDLATWYGESVERKNRYGPEIIKCTGAGEVFNAEKAKERSPLFWKTPVKKRKKSTLQIYAGIHDGYTGSVPISHSINFYNKLLTDAHEKDKSRYVSEEDANTMLKTQTFPTQNPAKTIENRAILYQKSSKKIMLTIFEGTHEILKSAALDAIDAW
ncbi:alpha/beta hydrolase family protein [Runella aurantiaca]|uniref:Alpha/beta fold hydrolase n=1 Tax=Runella aurantiaca TaxID=2282308 RepID=A0A369IAW3_9BACT|nr:alpha/beta fold hydrolase [Runella aurantiaca]RDB04354.1 alpha/beta fold hydrolase [Runella aurantiaca]